VEAAKAAGQSLEEAKKNALELLKNHWAKVKTNCFNRIVPSSRHLKSSEFLSSNGAQSEVGDDLDGGPS
jgi:hypothetical protein